MSTQQKKFENYDVFVDKFKPKKTTDDCYTPENIYNAVADWVAKKYGVDRSTFCRPFYPGGDFEHYDYTGKIVVDNPPFSILSKIVKFYVDKGVLFYLFAPSITSITDSSERCTAIVVGGSVTYENGATVATSFLTNLEPHSIRMMTEPELFEILKVVNKENIKTNKPPTYQIPRNLITSARLYKINDVGIKFTIPRNESIIINRLDDQIPHKKSIMGRGLLVSDRLAEQFAQHVQRRASQKVKKELEPDYIWELSDREKEIIKDLNEGGK